MMSVIHVSSQPPGAREAHDSALPGSHVKPGSSSLRDVLAPKKGVSATELLLAANLIVAAALLAMWGGDYTSHLRERAAAWWEEVRHGGAYGWLAPTLFLHAGPGHLAANMVSLLAASGAVEFLAGPRWTLVVYVLTGMAGAWASYTGHDAPPLSVGASGAIFGLLGCAVSFIVRRRSMFNYAQRWKVWRVYVPLFLLLFVPVLANADVHAHAGGLAAGLILGLVLPPHPRISLLAAVDPMRDEDPEEPPDPENGEDTA